MKKSVKRSLVVLGISLLVGIIPLCTVMAQPPGMPQNPTQAPIDGGLSMLAVAGGAYALKKFRAKK